MSVTSSAPTPRPALPLIASQGLRRTWAQHGWVGSGPVLVGERPLLCQLRGWLQLMRVGATCTRGVPCSEPGMDWEWIGTLVFLPNEQAHSSLITLTLPSIFYAPTPSHAHSHTCMHAHTRARAGQQAARQRPHGHRH